MIENINDNGKELSDIKMMAMAIEWMMMRFLSLGSRVLDRMRFFYLFTC